MESAPCRPVNDRAGARKGLATELGFPVTPPSAKTSPHSPFTPRTALKRAPRTTRDRVKEQGHALPIPKSTAVRRGQPGAGTAVAAGPGPAALLRPADPSQRLRVEHRLDQGQR